MIQIDERFLGVTRSRIVTLLRRGRQTVEDLAGALGVTDNAVRAHLSALERDGLIRQCGARPSGGKPAVVYELTEEARELFARAHGPVLTQLIDVLEERQPTEETLEILREVGRRLGRQFRIPPGDRRTRLEHAAQLLNGLGGLAEVASAPGGGLVLRGYGCPFGSVIRDHPEACGLAESLLSELTGLPVHERCERVRGEPPQCVFEVESVYAELQSPRRSTGVARMAKVESLDG